MEIIIQEIRHHDLDVYLSFFNSRFCRFCRDVWFLPEAQEEVDSSPVCSEFSIGVPIPAPKDWAKGTAETFVKIVVLQEEEEGKKEERLKRTKTEVGEQ